MKNEIKNNVDWNAMMLTIYLHKNKHIHTCKNSIISFEEWIINMTSKCHCLQNNFHFQLAVEQSKVKPSSELSYCDVTMLLSTDTSNVIITLSFFKRRFIQENRKSINPAKYQISVTTDRTTATTRWYQTNRAMSCQVTDNHSRLL